jgi:predicted ATPase/DNA-binding winged helix-turn-helix (wHTH) protein
MKQFSGFQLDTGNECLWREGEQLLLARRPFELLRYLVEHSGRLISHDELLDALWPETYVQPQVLRTYVLELRKLLGDDAGQPRFIQTLPKRGYCFVARVEEDGQQAGACRAKAAATAGCGRGVAGREQELARLRSAMQRAARGERQVVFVTGESGIGKTALADAFCSGLEAARVTRGQCVEGYGSREEYYPLMEALGAMCAGADGESAYRVLGRTAPAWAAAMGRAPAMHTLPPVSLDRKPGDLCAALEEMAAERPLVLVLEDLQWADAGTLQLLSGMARRRAPAKLMVLATCVPESGGAAAEAGADDGALRRLKQNLLMRQLCEEIVLPPLTQTAMGTLLRRELGDEALPPGLTAFVHQRSEGNPLFAIALVEHLLARRFLVRENGDGWAARGSFDEMDAEVPDRLAQMIELDIERLRPEDQRVLAAGSTMGVAFPLWAIAAALEEDPARMEEVCDGLARRVRFVERAGEDELPDGARSDFYVFVHGLYREVLYRRQPAARRAQWHGRIADRMGELFRGREAAVARERSMHYEAAGDWRRASATLCEAAQHARERRATAEAENLVEQALRVAEHLAGRERAEAIAEIHAAFTATRDASAAGRKTAG